MKKLCIYDASEKSIVGLTWKLAATVLGGRFNRVLAVHSVEDCLAKVSALHDAGEVFDEVQIWAHGTFGHIIIGSTPVGRELWQTLAPIMEGTSATVWLRVCSFAATTRGKEACELAASFLGCRVAAFTHLIGTWACQSGLRGIHPGEEPSWGDTEGVDTRGHPIASTPFQPNTIWAWETDMPAWVFQPRLPTPPTLTLLSRS